MELITTQDIHHVIFHPLSVLYQLQFQDKDGCSKNGFSEFLNGPQVSENSGNSETNPQSLGRKAMRWDYRMVPYEIYGERCNDREAVEAIEKMKNCLVFSRPVSPTRDQVHGVEDVEREVMMNVREVLFQAFGNQNWWSSEFNWMEEDNEIGNWEGVLVINHHIHSIYLEPVEGHFEFLPFLTNLPFLKSLSLESHSLSHLPSIGQLDQLVIIEFAGDCHGGGMVDLPSEIGNLTRLKDLSFSSYPSQEPRRLPSDWSQLTNLNQFYFCNMELGGPIPDWMFEEWTKLTSITLSTNHLTGQVPTSLSLLQHVIFVELDDNKDLSLPSSLSHSSTNHPQTNQLQNQNQDSWPFNWKNKHGKIVKFTI